MVKPKTFSVDQENHFPPWLIFSTSQTLKYIFREIINFVKSTFQMESILRLSAKK
jgi:hypothetical protein